MISLISQQSYQLIDGLSLGPYLRHKKQFY